jgi:alanine racemase
MHRLLRPTWAEIDLDHLAANVAAVRSLLPRGCEIFAVVKSDGYGHGSLAVAKAALMAGATRLAVSIVDEAYELRRAGITAPILVLGYTPPDQGEQAARSEIALTVYAVENAQGLSLSARHAGKPLALHLKVDTGMGRLGVTPDDVVPLAEQLLELPGCSLEGVYTHFAQADAPDQAPTQQQLSRFNHALQQLRQRGISIPLIHAANSAAALRFPESQFNAVRLGLAMYVPTGPFSQQLSLKAAMTLKTIVSHVKWVPAGTAIGYGAKYSTACPSLIVTLPIGYGDGYPRLLSNKASVLLRGQRIPIVGAICMDQCMADATSLGEVQVGDEVVLWGRQAGQEITVTELSDLMGTIPYELIAGISKRVPRVYLRKGQIVTTRTLLGG